jgi:hypothetical protein
MKEPIDYYGSALEQTVKLDYENPEVVAAMAAQISEQLELLLLQTGPLPNNDFGRDAVSRIVNHALSEMISKTSPTLEIVKWDYDMKTRQATLWLRVRGN